MRVEHEYDRGGPLSYLAAWDVHRGKVFGRCEPTTGIDPFRRLVRQVMTIEPYASADRVFWADVEHRPDAFQDLYNLAARPFNWKYTKNDLDALLARVTAHEPTAFLPAAA